MAAVVAAMITLRPYQEDVVAGARTLWALGRRRIAAVLATGAGKTVVFSALAGAALSGGRPVLVLAHRSELLDQAIDKLTQVNPGARIGRMQGPTKQYRADIVVASVQTASTPGSLHLLRSRRWGLIVVDETHHVAADTYLRVLRELGAYADDGPLTLGVTATLDRADGRALGEIFEEVVEPTVGLLDLVRQGYLVRPRGVRVRIADMDLRTVRKVAGDFNQGQLGAAMMAGLAPQRIVEAWIEHAKGRPTVAFLPTVAVSEQLAEAFREAGFTAQHVDAKSPDEVRTGALAASAAGQLDVICNVGLFGEGTDMPWVSAIILKMTSSSVVYTQQVGRGLRLHPGKEDCVILDPSGVTGRHKLATMANLDGADRPADVPDELLMYEDDEPEPDEAEDEPGATVIEYEDGDRLDHELIDLFGESHSAWLRTAGGHWFLPAADGFVFLAPRRDAPGRYDLAWASRGNRGVLQADMQIEYAMAAGDAYVAQFPIWQADRSAAWRSTPAGRRYEEAARQRASAVLDGRS